MKIQVGTILQWKNEENPLALNIPGLGVIKSELDEDDLPFSCVQLDKKQLMILRDEINKELGE